MSKNDLKFYIDGEWVAPVVPKPYDVINPATEEVAGQISLGSAADVERAVAAARRAFPSYSMTEGRLTASTPPGIRVQGSSAD
jgi:aldehyde dehydrogenase (NAD+)